MKVSFRESARAIIPTVLLFAAGALWLTYDFCSLRHLEANQHALRMATEDDRVTDVFGAPIEFRSFSLRELELGSLSLPSFSSHRLCFWREPCQVGILTHFTGSRRDGEVRVDLNYSSAQGWTVTSVVVKPEKEERANVPKVVVFEKAH
jgi:hypothetical protein